MKSKVIVGIAVLAALTRSEEHTSELQSRLHLVCRLLLEKKKKNTEFTSDHSATVSETTRSFISLLLIKNIVRPLVCSIDKIRLILSILSVSIAARRRMDA